MRLLTEPEAKKLVCPYMSQFGVNPSQGNCIASACMAWQDFTPNNMIDILKSGFSSKFDQGFCDYNGFSTPKVIGTVGDLKTNTKS